jgi:hypothetical protein
MLNLRQLYRQLVPSGATTLYVATTGSDSAAGTQAAPFATIGHAASVAAPGTRILVAAGTYGYTSVYNVKGNASAWVSIESVNDTVRPVISVADNSGDDGVDIQLSTFVGFYGFEVVGLQTSTQTGPSGVCVFNNSHHIRVWNNNVHDFPGGAVNCFFANGGGWDLVDVCFNTLHDCCKYSDYNTSGISFYAAVDLTGQTLDGTYGYRAIGNYIYNCECTVAYTPGGVNYVTDGNGMSYDSLYVPNNLNPSVVPYTKRGLAEGNIVVACGGRGLHIYNAINVDDFSNTYIGNLRTSSPAITNGVETDAQYNPALSVPNGVTHQGNIICPLNTPNTTDSVSTYTANVMLGGTQSVPSGNTGHLSTGLGYFAGNPSQASLATALPIGSFQPVAVDLGAKGATATGYQALGAGARTGNITSVVIPASPTFDTGNSLGSWTIGAGTPTSTGGAGNPAPSYNVPGGAYMYRNIGAQATYQTDVACTGSLVDFFFGCNSTGAGYMARLDLRGGGSVCGFATTSSWTAWSTPADPPGILGTSLASANWYTLVVTVSGGTATLTINGTVAGSISVGAMGAYIGLIGDGAGGGNFDNILTAPAGSPTSAQLVEWAAGALELPVVPRVVGASSR